MRTPTPWVLPSQPATRADLITSGVSPRMIRTRVASGDLVQVRRGVYVRASDWPDDPAARHLVAAHAEQAAHPDAVISHQSAALAWGIPTPGLLGWETSPVSVTLPPGRSMRPTSTVHHTGTLPGSQVVRHADGYLVTSPARTAVDLAADLALPEALVVLDSAARLIIGSMVGSSVRRRDYANPRLGRAAAEFMEQAATTVRATRLRPALSLVVAGRESSAESLSAGHMVMAGVPTPQFQAEIRTPKGFLYPDFYWPDRMLIGEVDGAVKYRDAQAFVLEKEREQLLRDLGYRIVRWLAKEILLRPHEVMGRIDRALAW